MTQFLYLLAPKLVLTIHEKPVIKFPGRQLAQDIERKHKKSSVHPIACYVFIMMKIFSQHQPAPFFVRHHKRNETKQVEQFPLQASESSCSILNSPGRKDHPAAGNT